MDRADMTWDETVVPYAQLSDFPHPMLASPGYYCLVAAELDADADLYKGLELLFVAGSGESNLRQAASASTEAHDRALAAAEAAGKQVVVMLGEITDTSLGRKTKEFLHDVELCLALRNAPKVSQVPADFVESRHLSVVNRGDFAPLKWRSLMTPA
ncbi:MAG: hypothetical protein H6747_02970 [Deltaproteobacteria bacterium]|nr:hypothetical protein [Deltaproteobacteria bacterium]